MNGYTVIKPSTPFIDGNALVHIIVVSVAAGAGLAIAFGLILLGVEYGQQAKTEVAKAGGWVLGIAATAFCIAAIVAGIYIMIHPKKSTPNKVVKSASASALVTPHHTVAPYRKLA